MKPLRVVSFSNIILRGEEIHVWNLEQHLVGLLEKAPVVGGAIKVSFTEPTPCGGCNIRIKREDGAVTKLHASTLEIDPVGFGFRGSCLPRIVAENR